MAENALRARSATELVDAGIQLTRRHYVPILTVSAIGMIPWLFLQPFVDRLISGIDTSGPVTPETLTFGLGALLASLGSLVLTGIWRSLAGAAIITVASQGYLEGKTDVGAAISAVGDRIGAVLYASFYKGLVVGLGFLLFIVGGFYFYGTYSSLPSTVMLEKLSGPDGVKRSKQLATGNRGHVLKAMVLTFIIFYVINFAASSVVLLFVGRSNQLVLQGVTALVQVLVYPIVPVTEMLVYFDLRIRTEGFDVEMMAARLDTAGTAPAP